MTTSKPAAPGPGAHASADVNYRYFVHYAEQLAAGRDDFRMLDFGCGNGQLVRMLRDAGLDAFGADVFYEGADQDDAGPRDLVERGFVREIGSDGVIPFEDGFFDLVVSNQVFEHVEDLEAVNAQLGRVLKPDGVMYHHFPSREVLREAHIGIPLAHRFRPGRPRTLYTLALRRAGLGAHKHENSSAREWTDAKLDWIDRWCFYRPYDEVRATLGHGYDLAHREIDYCRFRAAGHPLLERVMRIEILRGPLERIFRRVGFMAIEQRRAAGSGGAGQATP